MDFLLLYVSEDVSFDLGKVRLALEQIPGTYDLRTDHTIGAVLQCKYDFGSDSTIVRLTEGLETISISGTGEASIRIALEIQRQLAVPLHAVDSDYSFDILLGTEGGNSELRQALGAQ